MLPDFYASTQCNIISSFFVDSEDVNKDFYISIRSQLLIVSQVPHIPLPPHQRHMFGDFDSKLPGLVEPRIRPEFQPSLLISVTYHIPDIFALQARSARFSCFRRVGTHDLAATPSGDIQTVAPSRVVFGSRLMEKPACAHSISS
ncbi:hypothetical protein L596_014323 [Steinernema carpocapsae]|uniref:Uncharacterized protein n=1 Tax=Steinernema carpocapsae TaxID=34508 RepID=A0A4U5NCI8_STECR|nr:hypothetical protein L596_014323 [Steinernema carpocapsae]